MSAAYAVVVPPKPRPEIERMTGYVPGEQPRAGERVVKLNTNEAAFPPPASVVHAVREASADALRRYPDPSACPFREAVAKRHDVAPEQVLAANGSDDVLTVLTRAFVPPGGRIASPWPTYSLYPTLCEIQGCDFAPVAWRDGWRLPIEALLAEKPHAIYFANPNAPSGTAVDSADVAELAGRFDGLLLVDEAYADYADTDCVGLIAQHANVIVSRTTSKGFALAGMRLGYAIGHAEAIAQLHKVRDSYNVDAVAQAAGVAAMQSLDEYRPLWQDVRNERSRLTRGLEELGFAVPPSQANFVLGRHPTPGRARELFAGLKRSGILVRYFDQPGLDDCLRVTVGTVQQNTAFLAALGELMKAEPISEKVPT